MKIIDQDVEFITPKTQDEWITEAKYIELAARNCYKSENVITDNSWQKMIKSLKTRNHGAMIEFGNFIVRLITNRGVLAELTRHRMASFAVESTRWVNYANEKFGSEITVIRPSTWYQYSDTAKDLWTASMKNCEEDYFAMLKEGCSPQQARGVLPNDLKTDIIMKVNFRELLHIINLRTAKDAHPDIVDLFTKVKNRCIEKLPVLFE